MHQKFCKIRLTLCLFSFTTKKCDLHFILMHMFYGVNYTFFLILASKFELEMDPMQNAKILF